MRPSLLLAVFFTGILPVRSAPVEPDRINKAAGSALFPSAGTLWEEDAAVVAARLGLPLESETSNDASYRLYPAETARVFGCRPYSISLSAQKGKPVALNIIFANKGDSVGQFARTGPGQRPPLSSQILRDYRRAIRRDEGALDKTLQDLLGPSTREKTGSSAGLAERSLRRDWNNHALLLVSADDEYVALRIVPPDDLLETGRVDRVPDAELRARLAAQIERRPNGDVVIREIPMVDQGPKGFCVPATMERMLRHLGIPADMYLLAMAANTRPGGGTTVDDVVYAVRDKVRCHGRRVVSFGGKPDGQTVRQWVEQGIPVLWALNTSEAVDSHINRRTSERAGVEDWAEWNSSLETARRGARTMARGVAEGHVCLIIGYNEETDEIAISDSWGPGYAERWVTAEEAAAISQGSMAAVAW
jgi:hypothetical protein